MLALFGQTFDPHDLAVIGVLIILEGVLSIDNALVLGILAKRLPKHMQSRALTYGLVGAFVFRLIAIATAALLMQMRWVKLAGGGYLVFVAVKHLFFDSKDQHGDKLTVDEAGEPTLVSANGTPLPPDEEVQEIRKRAQPVPVMPSVASARSLAYTFWSTVFVIEMTDIAFAVDSILAAVAMVNDKSKIWIVFTGGFLGVILMRFAAVVFIKLLEKFPRFEIAAYLLIIVIGGKLILDWTFNSEHHHPLDFHSPTALAFWVFWGLMLLCFAIGFMPSKKQEELKIVA